MTRIAGSRISLKQALSLGLLILAVYFPIILYVNLSTFDIWGQLDFLLFPAGVNFAFYVMFILAADRIIDRLSKAYRYILEQKDNAVVRLSTELDFISSYAFLLISRYDMESIIKNDNPLFTRFIISRDFKSILALTVEEPTVYVLIS